MPKGLWTYTKRHRSVEVLRKMMNQYYRRKYIITGRLKTCDAIIYANKETKDYLGIEGEIITEVAAQNVLDKVPCKVIDGKCVFLVAGRMIYRKGYNFLLDAIKTIPENKDYEVRFVGSGPEVPMLERRVQEDRILAKHVVFVPKIPYTEMRREYEKANVFIMPSIRETTGTVLLEAMGFGLPVIAINKFGSGLILNENLGWLFSGNSKQEYIASLAAAMEYCIIHPEEVRRRGENILKESHKYTWEKKVAIFNDIYKEVLAK